MSHFNVVDRGLTAPPITTVNDVNKEWLVGVGATGPWAGWDNSIAKLLSVDGGDFWQELTPKDGDTLQQIGLTAREYWNGTSWQLFPRNLQESYAQATAAPQITTADDLEPLSVQAGDTDASHTFEVRNVAGTATSWFTGAGALITIGNVNNRDMPADGAKLDGIEPGADVTDEASVTAAFPIDDDTPLVYQTGDPTANVGIDAKNVSAGQTRFLVTPDADLELRQRNYAGAAAPEATDDSTAGYDVGSRWFDTVGGFEFVCLDATPGAAVWKETTVTSAGGASLTYTYNFSLATSETNPSNRNCNLNNASQPAATNLVISAINRDNVDVSSFIARLDVGDGLFLASRSDSSRYMSYDVSGPAVDNGAWLTVPITNVEAGTALQAEQVDVILLFGIAPALPTVDTTPIVYDDADNTKQVRIEAGNLPTATTAAMIVHETVDLAIDGSGNFVPTTRTTPMTLSLEVPAGADDVPTVVTDREITVDSMSAFLKGGDVSSVTWTARFGADPSAGGTEVVVGGTTTTQTTSIQSITTLSNPTIPAGSALRIDPTAVTGTSGWLHVTIHAL